MTKQLLIASAIFVPFLAFAQTNVPSKIEGGKSESSSSSQKVGSSSSWSQYCTDSKCSNVSSGKPASAATNPVPQGGVMNPMNSEIGKKHPNTP